MQDFVFELVLSIWPWFVVWIFCGIATAAIGSSFWWGFLFGPLGVLIGAVRVLTKRPAVVIVDGSRRTARRTADGKIIVRTRDGAAQQKESREETEEERFNRMFEAAERGGNKTKQSRPAKRIYIRKE